MAVAEVRKKWHLPPAFNVEYVAYYEDRNNRIQDLKVCINLIIVIRVDDNLYNQNQIIIIQFIIFINLGTSLRRSRKLRKIFSRTKGGARKI